MIVNDIKMSDIIFGDIRRRDITIGDTAVSNRRVD